MKVHHLTPYALDKNLGKAYNEAMDLIPEGDTACITDYDVLFLTPDGPAIVAEYARLFPDAMLVCYTNRIHPTSKQLADNPNNDRVKNHIQVAEQQKRFLYQVTELKENVSGFLMALPKKIWQDHPFDQTGGCLGVDTLYWKRLVKAKVKILRMDGLYVWHTYRLATNIHDKSHLV